MKQREIKFRVWGDTDHENPTMEYDPQWRHTSDCRLSTWFSMSGYHVMQFTGLHDKNGVEIYHKDILRTELSDGTHIDMSVEFGETFEFMKDGYFGWYCKVVGATTETETDYCQLNSSVPHTSYIIGNIYQHPHLLQNLQQ